MKAIKQAAQHAVDVEMPAEVVEPDEKTQYIQTELKKKAVIVEL